MMSQQAPRLLPRTIVFAILALSIVSFATPMKSAPARNGIMRPARQTSPDLCALLQQLAGGELTPGTGWQGCYTNLRAANSQFEYISIELKNNQADARHDVGAFLKEIKPGVVPISDFGDPGYAVEIPIFACGNDKDSECGATFYYARGCYSVYGRSGQVNLTEARDPEPLRQVLIQIDAALQKAPYASACGAPAASTTTSGLDLTVDHIEVVQVLQTADNKIPLVAGKKTVVRVFVKAASAVAGQAPFQVSGALYYWPAGQSEVEIKEGTRTVQVNPDVYPDRNLSASSMNFVIPSDKVTAGTFSLRVVINPDHAITEADYSNNEATEPFEFVQRNGLRVGYVRIGYKPPSESSFSWPTDSIAKYDSNLRKLFPVADAGIQYYEMPWRVRTTRNISTETLGTDLIFTLREFYDHLEGDKPDILIGWVAAAYSKSFEYGGLAESAEPGKLGHVALVVDYQTTYSDESLTHEVGHDLGLEHTGTTSDPTPPCRVSSGSRGYWPPEYGDSAAIRVTGFDTTLMQAVPNTYYDIMSYCTPNVWISPFHYQKLFDQNVKPATDFNAFVGDKIVARGWGMLRGGGGNPRFELISIPASVTGGSTNVAPPLSAAAVAANLLPGGVNSIAAAPRREGSGDYCLSFSDAAGATLYERCFDPQFVDQESLQPLDEAGFVVTMPNPGIFTRVALRHTADGVTNEIAVLTASSHAPKISITAPKAGDRWAGEHTISWTASDDDGDTGLRYDILYSADGKKSWYPLAVNWRESEYTFSTDEILPSEQTYIRILASDGFNTSQADVGPLVVPQQANSPVPPPGIPVVSTPAAGGLAQLISAIDLRFVVSIGAVLLIGLFVLLLTRSRIRSRATANFAGVGTAQPAYHANAPAAPPSPPTAMNPFQWALEQRVRLRGELAAGRITPQQYEAALTIRDAYGRYWTLGAADDLWYVYDGRAWVSANP